MLFGIMTDSFPPAHTQTKNVINQYAFYEMHESFKDGFWGKEILILDSSSILNFFQNFSNHFDSIKMVS